MTDPRPHDPRDSVEPVHAWPPAAAAPVTIHAEAPGDDAEVAARVEDDAAAPVTAYAEAAGDDAEVAARVEDDDAAPVTTYAEAAGDDAEVAARVEDDAAAWGIDGDRVSPAPEGEGFVVPNEGFDLPPETGDDAVDQAVRGLAAAMGESLEEQVAAYETAHRILQDRLADVEG